MYNYNTWQDAINWIERSIKSLEDYLRNNPEDSDKKLLKEHTEQLLSAMKQKTSSSDSKKTDKEKEDLIKFFKGSSNVNSDGTIKKSSYQGGSEWL